MLGEGGTDLSDLESAVRDFLGRDDRSVDLKRLRAVIDSLEGDFASRARDVRRVGGPIATGAASVVSWIAPTCGMSSTSVADRLCVGAQLESLPADGQSELSKVAVVWLPMLYRNRLRNCGQL